MANYNRDWSRNRNSSNQPWDDDRYDQYRSDNDSRNDSFRNDRYRENYDRREMRGLDEDQGKMWGRGNRYDSNRGNMGDDDRYMGDNDSSYNRGIYGNSTGVSRGSSNYLAGDDRYSSRDYTGRSSDMGRSRRYPGSDYGNRYSNRYRDEDRDWWDKTKDEVSSWFGDDEASRRRRMDEIREGHRGRGPKGYSRSDERIREDLNDRLMDDDHIDASDINVSIEKAEVILSGTVNSKFEKRHAEDIAESVSGVKNVENRLRVSDARSNNYGSSSSNFGASGASPVGAFDTTKPGE